MADDRDTTLPTFNEVWADYKARGYDYGDDALEHVKFGWQICIAALIAKRLVVPIGNRPT